MKLIKSYLLLHYKSTIEYKLSFILLMIGQVQFLFIDAFVVKSLLEKFNLLSKYNLYEVMLGFSGVWLGFSIAETFGRGFDEFKRLIIKGGFDILLIRPRNIYLQIFGSNIEYAKMSRVIGSLLFFAYSAIMVVNEWTILKIILLVFMIVSATIIILSLFIIGASFSFKTVQGLEFFNVFTYGSKQVAEYPLDIFSKPFKLFFTYVIPIALINYFPKEYLTGRTDNIFYVIMPLFSIVLLIISVIIFNRGIKNYCSTGS